MFTYFPEDVLSGGDRDPRRWGKRVTMHNSTVPPAEWFCIKMGSDESRFNV